MKPSALKNNGARHPSVVEFSREHHHGLVFCRHAKKALTNGTDLRHIRMLFRAFWENDLQGHTLGEEAWMNSVPPSPLFAQVRSEHRELQALFSDIDSLAHAELVGLADRLEAHIRFEERVVFPAFPYI